MKARSDFFLYSSKAAEPYCNGAISAWPCIFLLDDAACFFSHGGRESSSCLRLLVHDGRFITVRSAHRTRATHRSGTAGITSQLLRPFTRGREWTNASHTRTKMFQIWHYGKYGIGAVDMALRVLTLLWDLQGSQSFSNGAWTGVSSN